MQTQDLEFHEAELLGPGRNLGGAWGPARTPLALGISRAFGAATPHSPERGDRLRGAGGRDRALRSAGPHAQPTPALVR